MVHIFSRIPSASSSEILALERANLNAWPSAWTLWNGDWCLRLTPGARSRRTNSVTCFNAGDASNVGQRVARMLDLFERHDKRATFRWTPLFPNAVLETLLNAGWHTAAESIVMTKPADLALSERSPESESQTNSSGEFSPNVMDCEFADWIGKLALVDPSQTESIDALQMTLASVVPNSAKLLIEAKDGTPAATAFSVADEDYLGLMLVYVQAEQRRRGLADALLSAALKFGTSYGATTAWLQVEADNEPAIALYSKAGFQERYRYIYLQTEGAS